MTNLGKLCSVDGCARPSRSKSMCKRHYDEQHRAARVAKEGEALRDHRRRYYADNKDAFRRRRQKFAKAHPNYYRDIYQDRKEPVKARARAWLKANPERARATHAAYYRANGEDIRRKVNLYRQANPDAVKNLKANYRARKRKADGSHTEAEIARLLVKQRGRCACCKIKLNGQFHRDHRTPLTMGGSNRIENIQLTCPTCNLQKNRKDPITFMQEKGFLL